MDQGKMGWQRCACGSEKFRLREAAEETVCADGRERTLWIGNDHECAHCGTTDSRRFAESTSRGLSYYGIDPDGKVWYYDPQREVRERMALMLAMGAELAERMSQLQKLMDDTFVASRPMTANTVQAVPAPEPESVKWNKANNWNQEV